VYGFDGGKKVKGRKQQTLVDSLGLYFYGKTA
jgi:putative transposase